MQASELLLLKVVSEFAVWHKAGLISGLHILTAGFDIRQEDVRPFAVPASNLYAVPSVCQDWFSTSVPGLCVH